MKDLISSFPNHLREGLEIAEKAQLRNTGMRPENVLITGLGGSGIGGTIVSELCSPTARVPMVINKGYNVPHWVGTETLVIACSYSGNTEETLEASAQSLEQGAMMAGITSGGKLKSLCEERGLNHIIIPGGNPPRSMLGYSLVQLLRLLNNWGVQTPSNWQEDIRNAADFLDENAADIHAQAKKLAEDIDRKIVAVYATAGLGGVATRWRQQINENAKMLGWDAVIPEMNHNELVGWQGGTNDLAAIVLRSEFEHKRNALRVEKNIKHIRRRTQHVHEIMAKGKNPIESALYLINLGDWTSYYLAEISGCDIFDIAVIEDLKEHLQKFSP